MKKPNKKQLVSFARSFSFERWSYLCSIPEFERAVNEGAFTEAREIAAQH